MKNVDFHKLLAVTVLTLFMSLAQAQTTISGTVTGDDGEPLIGASILVVGTTTGTITDADGSFSLDCSNTPPFNIDVSYTGYDTKTIEITGSQSDLNIVLVDFYFICESMLVNNGFV